MHIKQELERTTSGMCFIKHRITKDNSVMEQSFHAGSRIFILMIIFIGVLLSGCGSDGYSIELCNDYYIEEILSDLRCLSKKINDSEIKTVLVNYSVTDYFVVDDLIGMYGFINKDPGPLIDPYYDDRPKEYVFYIVDTSPEMIFGPYSSNDQFIHMCTELGIDLSHNVQWLNPDKVWEKMHGL